MRSRMHASDLGHFSKEGIDMLHRVLSKVVSQNTVRIEKPKPSAAIAVIASIERTHVAMLEFEKELLERPEGDASLAKKFETLRASLTRAEHAARTKLTGETK